MSANAVHESERVLRTAVQRLQHQRRVTQPLVSKLETKPRTMTARSTAVASCEGNSSLPTLCFRARDSRRPPHRAQARRVSYWTGWALSTTPRPPSPPPTPRSCSAHAPASASSPPRSTTSSSPVQHWAHLTTAQVWEYVTKPTWRVLPRQLQSDRSSSRVRRASRTHAPSPPARPRLPRSPQPLLRPPEANQWGASLQRARSAPHPQAGNPS
jgi:hypothetical protein